MNEDEKRAAVRAMDTETLVLALEAAAFQARDGYTRELRASAEESRDVLREEIRRRIEGRTA